MQREEPDDEQPIKNKFANQNKNVSNLVILLSSIFVIFLLLVSLDIIGIIQIGYILNYVPKLHTQASRPNLFIQTQDFDEDYNNIPTEDQSKTDEGYTPLVGQTNYIKVNKKKDNYQEISLLQQNFHQEKQQIIQEGDAMYHKDQDRKIEALQQDNPSPLFRSFLSKRQIAHNQNKLKRKNYQQSSESQQYKTELTQGKNRLDLKSHVLHKIVVEKPVVDEKEYSFFEFSNKLKVLLIYDQHSTVAEASLNVQVGSWHEPDEFPGLAHFLEHMLFQGSTTHPGMGYFDDFISNYGGFSNAYTEDTNTNYYFDINSDKLRDSLQIFAHFFIDPSFNKDAVELEVNAVNSEYEIAVSGDSSKLESILSQLSDSAHPASRFDMGNTESLMREGLIEALKIFFDDQYSSNLMTLAIKSNLNSLRLKKWMLEVSDFSQIPNKEYKFQDFSDLGLPIKQKLPLLVKMNILSQEKVFILNYQIPSLVNQKQTKPLDFITYFITSSHQGGLQNYLVNEKGFLLDIDAAVYNEGKAFHNFMIQMTYPIDNKQDFDQKQLAFRIAKVCSNYFEKLKQDLFDSNHEATQYFKDTYSQQQILSQINFKYMEDDDNAQINDIAFISESMSHNTIERVLSSAFIMEKFDAELVEQYLDHLTDSQNLLILIADNEYVYNSKEKIIYNDVTELTQIQKGSAADDLKFINNNQLSEYVAIYRLSYEVKDILEQTAEFIFKTESIIIDNLNLPELNQFVPDQLELTTLCLKRGPEYIVNMPQMNDRVENPYQDQSGSVQFTLQQQQYDSELQLPPYKIEEDIETSRNQEQIRSQIFIATKNSVPLVFQTPEECALNEFKYEMHNIYPQLLQKDLSGKIWWKLDRSYKMPSAYVAFKFETALDLNSLQKQTSLQLYNQYMIDKLKEDLYQPIQMGYEINLQTGNKGLSVQLYGFSSKIKQFFSHILECLTPKRRKGFLQMNIDTDESKRFERAKVRLRNELNDVYQAKLYEQVKDIYLPMILSQPFYSPQDKLKQLDQLQFKDLDLIRDGIFNNFRYSSLFVGNLLKDDVFDIIKDMKGVLSKSTSEIQSSYSTSQIIDIHGQNIIYPIQSLSSDLQDQNGATLNFYQIHRRDKKSYQIMQLLSTIFQNKAFKYLRTELQLGYVVTAKFITIGCVDGAQIIVQGPSHAPYEVNQHIEDFVLQFGVELTNMSFKELRSLKKGVVARLSDNISSLKEEGSYLWDHIGDLAFDEKQVAASMIKQLKKKEIIDFYNSVFKDLDRGKLSIQLYGKGMQQQLLNVQNKEEFIKLLSSKGLTQDDATFKENVVFNSQQFGNYVTRAYNCDQQISNI